MWKIRYDPNTLRVMAKKFVLFKTDMEEKNTFYMDKDVKPRGWFVDESRKCLISKPSVLDLNLVGSLTFEKPVPITQTPKFIGKQKKVGQKELAVVRLIGIGDIVMTLPLLSSLREKFSDWYITYWTSSQGARILYGNEDIDRVEVLHYKTPREGLPPVPKEVCGYDVVVNLINKFDFGAVTWTRPRVDNIFLSASNQLVKYVDRTIDPPIDYAIPKLSMTDDQIRFALDFSSIHNLFDKTVVGCVLSSHGECRFWELSKWKDLAECMPEHRFIWFSDDIRHQSVPHPLNVINTSNQLGFEEYLSLLSICAIVVCPDTAAMHLSEMLHIPCLVLEGSTNFSFHSKYYSYVDSIKLKKPLKCQPCYDWQLKSDCYRQEGLPWCLNRIKVRQVKKQIKSLVKEI